MTITNTGRRLALVGLLALVASLMPLSSASAAHLTGVTQLTADDNTGASIAWSNPAGFPNAGLASGARDPEYVLIGRDDIFPDNLASGALQGAEGPLLLTDTDELEQEVIDEIERLGVDRAIILGEFEAISQEVEDDLNDLVGTVDRLGGETRIETAIEITSANVAATETGEGDSSTAILARAFDSDGGSSSAAFADSLAAGGWAAADGFGVLLTQTDTLTPSVADYLAEGEIDNIIIVGGENAVSESVADEIRDLGITVERVAGDNRAGTAVEIAQARGFETATDAPGVILVEGFLENAWASGFPAAATAALEDYPIILSNGTNLPPETVAYADGSEVDNGTDSTDDGTDIVCGPLMPGAGDEGANGVDNGTDTTNDEPRGNTGPNTTQDFAPACEELDRIINGDGTVADNATFTDAPELVRVTMINQGSDFVNLRFVFDEPVDGKAPVAGCFHLYAFDQAPFSGANAQNVCGDPATDGTGGHAGDDNTNPASADGRQAFVDAEATTDVVVQFQIDAADFDAVSVATVDWDAVRDSDDIENLEGDFGLIGESAAAGRTIGPDLLSLANIDRATNSVEFVFDEDIETIDSGVVADDAANFVIILVNGDRIEGQSTEIRSQNQNVVRVTFAPGSMANVTSTNIARGVVLAGTVTDDGGVSSNPLQAADEPRQPTNNLPDLASVTFDEELDEATFTFDAAVQVNGDASFFQVFDRSGDETEGTSAVRSQTDNSAVIVTFAGGVLERAVGASVDSDAVVRTTGVTQGVTNEEDELGVSGQDFDAGVTTGPDLIGARVELSADPFGDTTRVTFIFDENVDTSLATPVTGGGNMEAGRFFIYHVNGTPTRGVDIESIDDNEVRVTFGSDVAIDNAVVATVNDLAVFDSDGNGNVEGAEQLINDVSSGGDGSGSTN